ncbi:MAG: glycogen synthase GlgA [Planctomycetaceae bacterium]|nr:glycogen synthase GlgA [Planctomycetales bacterium]MCB9922466.1 glycogen synthase GlgA [Planctomycetaceae bacterium]
MNILIASSEVAPFSKTGGLADVCRELPLALSRIGHQPMVFTPAYRQIRNRAATLERTDVTFEIPIGSKVMIGHLLTGVMPDSSVPVYFVDQPEYFDRDQLYQESGQDYRDNCERYVFFSRAVMEAIRLLDLPVDVIHCNDWQTGLIPALLRIEYQHARGYEDIVTLMTIHNMAYQGHFWHWDMLLTGLDWKYFNWKQMEFWGNLNLMKTGLVFADAISTVSARYAEEIQHDLGCGLEGVLRQRSASLFGINNGVDYELWNPATDPQLAANYSVDNWHEGKAACKTVLQREFGLPTESETPLIGLIGRLADQKGWDLVANVMQRWVNREKVQWAILGEGEERYHEILERLATQRPDRVGIRFEFSDPIARHVEAGADMLLMPSRFEPCGLNQLHSLKYGTVPIVRETGGLADSICDASAENLSNGTANGFSFQAYDADQLEVTLQRACDTFRTRRDVWRNLVETGMKQDWSWNESAQQYVSLYRQMRRQHDMLRQAAEAAH